VTTPQHDLIEVSEGGLDADLHLAFDPPFVVSAAVIIATAEDCEHDDVLAAVNDVLTGAKEEAIVLGFVGTAFRYRRAAPDAVATKVDEAP
jgi:hypothetical protein